METIPDNEINETIPDNEINETIPDNELKQGWFSSMITVLGALNDPRSKVSSISYVPDQLRKSREEAYVPKVVSIGPLHRGRSRELLDMEATKWNCMLTLFLRTKNELESFKKCGEAILKLDGVVRACYGANDIKLNRYDLAKIMLLDGCFLLELLVSNDKKLAKTFIKQFDESPGAEIGKREQVLSDLKLLENQIPFFILTVLFQTLSDTNAENENSNGSGSIESRPEDDSPKAEETDGCAHFLDLIHMFMIGKEENNDHHSINSNGSGSTESKQTLQLKRCALSIFGCSSKSRPEDDRPKAKETDDHHSINLNDSGSTESKQTLQLECCAARLEAAGVDIVRQGSKRGSMSRLENTKFIKDDVNKINKLVIQQLHITKTEEFQWRNLIAWEQNRIAYERFLKVKNRTRCKFSQYALLFKDLVCCEHDTQLLKNRGVLRVDNGEKRSNEDLMTLFQEMAKGIDVDLTGDESHRELVNDLNAYSGAKGNRRMILWHRWKSIEASARYTCREWLGILIHDYTPNVWKTLGVITAVILLVLTIAQTILAAISL